MVALGFHPGFVGQRQIHLHDDAVHKIIVAFALLAGGELDDGRGDVLADLAQIGRHRVFASAHAFFQAVNVDAGNYFFIVHIFCSFL